MSSDYRVGDSLFMKHFTKAGILGAEYAMIALVSLFVFARLVFQATQRKKLELQDHFLYFAYACYLGACSLFIVVISPLFEIQDITTGKAPMPADFRQTLVLVSRLVWSAQVLFTFCLWSVKFSLLCLYRKLLVGLPSIYIKIWWTLVVICFVTFVGCIASMATSCKNMSAFFATSQCHTPRDQRRTAISLFLTYGLDVFTNTLVMALPIRLVWNLQMPRRQKIAICMLFGTGLICISFATIRIVQIGTNYKGQAGTPDSRWMALWSLMELSVAVIIGCCPAFAALIRSRRTTKQKSPHGYVKQPGDSSGDERNVGLRLKTLISPKSRYNGDDLLYSHGHSSQEQLATSPAGITVTTALHQDEGVTALPKNA